LPQVRLKELNKTLRTQFQLRELRPGQEEVIRSVLAGKNTLSIMPTGGGKSLCYQLPAVHLPGTTIIVSPLISLMKDQREKLGDVGIDALEFNSSLTRKEQNESLEQIGDQGREFIYATPERLENPEFIESLKNIKIDFVVIDEAHCVSQWGHDFRPAYLNIHSALKALGNPPVLALTATATPEVVEDIRVQLRLKDLQVFYTSLLRDNLYFSGRLVENDDEKKTALLEYVTGLKGSGIIYASTVRAVKEIHAFLTDNGISALMYHGKLKKSDREKNQNEFMNNSPRIMIATNAFGMGIDKADIRYVLHYNFPGSLEAYYQEAGRAGRDGDRADCILLYLKKDKCTQTLFLARKYPTLDELTSVYTCLRDLAEGGGIIARADIEHRLPSLSTRKILLIVAYLKQLGIVTERVPRRLGISRKDLSEAQIAFIAENYKMRALRDQEKLKQVIIYAQSAMCRWKILVDYFEEETDWRNCGHCDNCEHPVLEQIAQLS
jgi:ATP-dependent DNA helicase RecQ